MSPLPPRIITLSHRILACTETDRPTTMAQIQHMAEAVQNLCRFLPRYHRKMDGISAKAATRACRSALTAALLVPLCASCSAPGCGCGRGYIQIQQERAQLHILKIWRQLDPLAASHVPPAIWERPEFYTQRALALARIEVLASHADLRATYARHFLEALPCKWWPIAEVAVRALGKLPPQEKHRMALCTLLSHRQWQVRLAVVWALNRMGFVEALQRVAKKDKRFMVRYYAARAVGKPFSKPPPRDLDEPPLVPDLP